jgi:hypothetical protein
LVSNDDPNRTGTRTEIRGILTRSTCLRIESAVFLGIEEAETVVGTGGRRETEGVADCAGMATVETEETKRWERIGRRERVLLEAERAGMDI